MGLEESVMKAISSRKGARKKKGAAKNLANARKPKPKTVAKKLVMKSKTYDELRFQKIEKQNAPRFYGKVTIYTSKKLGLWRVKPEPGNRKTFQISFTSEPRKAWADVIKKVRELEKS